MSKQSRICVEKLPVIHQEKLFEAKQDGHTNAHIERLRAAFLKDNIWPLNSVLKIGFLESESKVLWTPLSVLKQYGKPLDPLETILRDKNLEPSEVVKQVITERIIPLVGLRIEFVNNISQANVRVGFDPNDGSWAYVGTDQLKHEKVDEATVNLGWLDVGTIIHEFCHVLGMVHEHQNARGKQIDWDNNAVYSYMQRTQGWDKDTTNINVLDKYQISQLNGSDFDPLSVMLYFFSGDLTKNGQGTTQNMLYSGLDVKWISNMYGKNANETDNEFYKQVYNTSLEDAIQKSTIALQDFKDGKTRSVIYNNMLFYTGIVLVILISGGLIWHFIKKKKKGKGSRRS